MRSHLQPENDRLFNNPCKLFIGHIPKGMDQKDVICFLSQYAPIRDFNYIRDPYTNAPRGLLWSLDLCLGCAFIDVDNEIIAENLINSLHGKVRLGNVSLL